MKRILLALALLFTLGSYAQENKDKINWMTIEEAEAASKEEPRKLIIDVYTDWCGWCKRMDKTTFSNPVIVDYINENYYAVKLDAEQKDSITFRDYTFKFVEQGRRGYHELAAALLNGKMSYPSIVYMDEELNMIQAIPGYQDAKSLEKIVKFFGENRHTELTFEDYQKDFESEL